MTQYGKVIHANFCIHTQMGGHVNLHGLVLAIVTMIHPGRLETTVNGLAITAEVSFQLYSYS